MEAGENKKLVLGFVVFIAKIAGMTGILLLLGFFASALFAVAFFLFPRPELGSAAGATLAALLFLAPLCLYALLIFGDACVRNGVKVARLSVRTSFVQLWGYGSGFIRALFS